MENLEGNKKFVTTVALLGIVNFSSDNENYI